MLSAIFQKPLFPFKAVLPTRVARFFLGHGKTGKNVPNEQKMYQMFIKYTKSP
jgi:hypothetical protein